MRLPVSMRAAGSPRDQPAASSPAPSCTGRSTSRPVRSRRLATVRLTGPGSAVGIADGADEQPWFGAVPPQRAAGLPELVLGSAGLSDATLQLVQACVPHRRLSLAGCDGVWLRRPGGGRTGDDPRHPGPAGPDGAGSGPGSQAEAGIWPTPGTGIRAGLGRRVDRRVRPDADRLAGAADARRRAAGAGPAAGGDPAHGRLIAAGRSRPAKSQSASLRDKGAGSYHCSGLRPSDEVT